jgi:hypothetical protein
VVCSQHSRVARPEILATEMSVRSIQIRFANFASLVPSIVSVRGDLSALGLSSNSVVGDISYMRFISAIGGANYCGYQEFFQISLVFR